MLSVEEQIKNLADAAFDATEPVEVRPAAPRSESRVGFLVVAAAVVLCAVVAVAVLNQRVANEVIAADDPTIEVVAVTDPLDIDLNDLAEASPQDRIGRLGPVAVVDPSALVGFDAETSFLVTMFGGEGNDYWQQVTATTPDGVDLVINVYGTDVGWPALDVSSGTEVIVRDRPGVQSAGGLTWLESDDVKVLIVAGPGVGVADIGADALALAEALTFVDTSEAWTRGERGQLGPEVEGQPMFAGVLGGVEWDVVASGEVVVVQAGEPRGQVFSEVAMSEGVRYTIGALPGADGVLIVGSVNAIAEVELVLANDVRVAMPTVDLGDGRTAFAVPIDDRLDPREIRFLDDGVEVQSAIDLTGLPPYLGGVASVGS